MKGKAKASLDKTLSFTQSSFAYKEPYNPKGNVLYHVKNKVWTFFSLRNVENEFVDFKSFYIDTQLREIYSDLYTSFRRSDKVLLQRSLSQPMFEVTYCLIFQYCQALLREKKENPFYKNIHSLKVVQSRNYASTDHLLPEDQWAQLTVKFVLSDSEQQKRVQYNMFERRLADKISYLDWKLSYIMDEEDLEFVHAKARIKDAD